MTNKFSEVRGAEPAAMPAGQARAQRVESRSGEAAEIRARLRRAEELLEEGRRLMASGRRSVWRYPQDFESLRDYALERMRLVESVRRLEGRVERLRRELAKAEGKEARA